MRVTRGLAVVAGRLRVRAATRSQDEHSPCSRRALTPAEVSLHWQLGKRGAGRGDAERGDAGDEAQAAGAADVSGQYVIHQYMIMQVYLLAF